MLSTTRFDNARPGGVGVLERVGECSEGRFVPLVRTELTGTVGGPIAELSLRHFFRFSREQFDGPIEAVYRFPLPGDAAVSSVRVRFGDVEISAELKPRKEAELDYKRAKREGRQSALVTRESPDVFTLQVSGIRPEEEVLITTDYVQLGEPDGIGFSFRVPLTTAPRYVRLDESESRHAWGQPLASFRDPGHRFCMRLRVVGKGALTSPSFPIVNRGEHSFLEAGEVVPDRDLVLVWTPEQKDAFPLLQVFTDGGEEPCFLALVTPPKEEAEAKPREVIVIVDHSGSMGGPKWDAADWAVEKLLSSLTTKDRFNLCLFHTTTKWFADEPVRATGIAIRRAVEFLHDPESGGTELGVALEQALSQESAKGDLSRQVLIITDAEVTDQGRILELVRREAAKRKRRRCSILCIDSAPNSFLARSIAEVGGGSCKFLTSSPEEVDITTALDAVLEEWSASVLSNVRLVASRKAVGLRSTAQDGMYRLEAMELKAGRSAWVAGRFVKARKPLRMMIEGCNYDAPTHECKGVRALYGARLVNELEMLMHSGLEEAEMSSRLNALGFEFKNAYPDHVVYRENRCQALRKALTKAIIAASLEHGVASSETAFVATRKEKGEVVKATVAVGNALPQGWSDSFLSSSPFHLSPKLVASQPVMAMVSHLAVPDADEDRSDLENLGYPIRSMCRLQFSGVPTFVNGEAVLVEVGEGEAVEGAVSVVFGTIAMFVHGATPGPKAMLQVFVGDAASPVMKVLLRDLLRHGRRPVNFRRSIREALRVVLVDPEGNLEGAEVRLDLS